MDNAPDIFKCEDCGEEFAEDSARFETATHEIVCIDCIDNNYFKCSCCGEYVKNDYGNATELDGTVCDDCMEDYFNCNDCGNLYHTNDLNYYHGEHFCDNCQNNNFYYCSDCDDYFRTGDSCGCDDARENDNGENIRYSLEHVKDKNALTIGCEIEAERGRAEDLQNMLPSFYALMSDGSLNNGDEIATPPANYCEYKKMVKEVCAILKKCDYKIEKSCGLHVHIGFPADPMKIKRLALSYYCIEDLILSLMPSHRIYNNYCKPLKQKFPIHEIKAIKADEFDLKYYRRFCDSPMTREDVESVKKDKYYTGRYYGINLHSIYYRGTVEFRTHNGTLTASAIILWSELLKKLVEYALNKYDFNEITRILPIPSRMGRIKEVSRILGLSKELEARLLFRAKKFKHDTICFFADKEAQRSSNFYKFSIKYL